MADVTTYNARSAAVPELVTLGAAEAARALRAKEFSSTELVRAVLDRVRTVNPRVNAVREVLADQALRAAAAADRRLAAGRPAGPLDGVPVTVKDNVDVAGSATTQGVAALSEAVAPVDAPAVAHLRAAGAIPVARTNMPDLALRWHTDSGLMGPTLNPWDARLTPGGSSGGEAVCLATGMSPLGIGNDLGGSLRWPSQCAGTTALRPTLGRVPHALSVEPVTKPVSLQLIEVQGPMARRVEDLRLALGVLSAPDTRDPWHVPVPAQYAPELPRRVHVLHEMAGVRYDPSVAEAVRRAAATLEAQGYELCDVPPPNLAEAAAGWARLMASDARRAWPAAKDLVSADGRRFMELIFQLVPALDLDAYAELFTTRQRIARAWAEYQRTTPLVLAPVFAGRAFRAGGDLDGVEAAHGIVDGLRATVAVNFLGLPAVAVPVGLVDGLPQGVQLIGPRFGEELCLRAAESIESALGAVTPVDPWSGQGGQGGQDGLGGHAGQDSQGGRPG
ncbi:amidase [Streptomyces sp. NPDC003032]